MMPFDGSFASVYEVLQASVEEVGLVCRRGNEIWKILQSFKIS